MIKIIFFILVLNLNILDFSLSCIYMPKLLEINKDCSFRNFHYETQKDLKYSHVTDEVDGVLVRIKYKPTVLAQKNFFIETPSSSSVCFKCGICLVVSEKLDQILTFAENNIALKELDEDTSANLLRPVCDFSFKSYGLREWNGLRFISQYPFLDHVPNSLEGLWTDILQQTCHFYLDHYGDKNLIKHWLNARVNVTSLLCRNDGLFRDCLNVNQGVANIVLPSRFLSPGNNVRINYPCV